MTNDELREEFLEETPKKQSPENQINENPTPSEEKTDGAQVFIPEEETEYTEEEIKDVLEILRKNSKGFRYYKPLPNGVTEETYDDYENIRSCGKIIGVTSIVVWALVMGYSLIYGFVIGFAASFGVDLTTVLSDPAVNNLMQILMTICMFTLPFLVAAKVNKYKIAELVPLTKSREGTRLPYFLFGLGFCAFAQIAVSKAATIFESMGFSYDLPESENAEGIFGFLLAVISTAVVPALMEEFGCRGIMFGIAEKKGGTTFALLISSAIFGLIHGNFMQIPFAFLVGLVLGVIRIKTGSLWVAILIHGVNNFASVVVDYAGDIIGDEITNTLYTVFLVLCMLASVVGVALLDKKGEEEYELKETNETEECKSTLKEKLLWFAKTPAVIVATVLFVLEACLYFIEF